MLHASQLVTYLRSKGKSEKETMVLAYYAQGLYLRIYDGVLFEDEFQAWDCGPVSFGVKEAWESRVYSPPEHYHYTVFLDEVLEEFEGLDGDALIAKAQNEAPWRDTYSKDEIKAIPLEAIKAFFATYPSTVVVPKWEEEKRQAEISLSKVTASWIQPDF